MHNEREYHDWGGDHIAKDEEFFCDLGGCFYGLYSVSKSLNLKENDVMCGSCMYIQQVHEGKIKHIWSH